MLLSGQQQKHLTSTGTPPSRGWFEKQERWGNMGLHCSVRIVWEWQKGNPDVQPRALCPNLSTSGCARCTHDPWHHLPCHTRVHLIFFNPSSASHPSVPAGLRRSSIRVLLCQCVQQRQVVTRCHRCRGLIKSSIRHAVASRIHLANETGR